MKGIEMRLFAMLVATALLPLSWACAANAKIAVLAVKNMQCQRCLLTVKKALQKVPGVEDAKVDLGQKTATVRFAPDKTNSNAPVNATTKAGFPSTVHRK